MSERPTCPVGGCGKPRNKGHLMCRRHWFRVSPAVRREVWFAFRRGDLHAHREAARVAIQEVEASIAGEMGRTA